MAKISKPTLYSPAGNIKKAFSSIYFGADGIYIGSNKYELRKSDVIAQEELKNLIEFCHKNNKKIDITLNAYLREFEIDDFIKHLKMIVSLNPDSIIISDPAVIILYEELKEQMTNKTNITQFPELILSTQANSSNFYSMKFWNKQGVRRIVAARELSLNEIYQIKKNQKEKGYSFEIEAFIHGAMCVSISGRCLLSLYMTNKKLSEKGSAKPRDANKGECVHPCRFAYLVEQSRENEFFPIEEDSRYSYILSSKDLCTLKYIPLLMFSGIDAFKIEGRMKSAFYASTITFAYRKAIDMAYSFFKDIEISENNLLNFFYNPEKFFECYPDWHNYVTTLSLYTELASHRPYTTGFYFDQENPDYMMPLYESNLIQKYLLFGESILNPISEFLSEPKKVSVKENINVINTKLDKNKYIFLAKNSTHLDKISLYYFSLNGISEIKNFIIFDLEKNPVSSIQHSKQYIIEFKDPIFINSSTHDLFFLFYKIN